MMNKIEIYTVHTDDCYGRRFIIILFFAWQFPRIEFIAGKIDFFCIR